MARRVALLVVLAGSLLVATAPAHAQDGTPTPSAEELWQDYPLNQGEPAPSVAPSPARTASRTAPADEPESELMIVILVAMLGSVAAASVALLLIRRRRSRPHDAAPPLAVPRLALAGPPASARTILFSSGGNGARRAESRDEPADEQAGVRPPDTACDWTAEVRWQHAAGGSRFCVVASSAQATGTVIARSEPLDWPPQDADAVQALVDAVDTLTEALTTAGWKPLPTGMAWYEKRFQWVAEPAATEWAPPLPGGPAPSPPVPMRRFRHSSEWPPGTEPLPRCEIRWRSGYTRSRFEAVMHGPGRGDRVIAESEPFRWLLMSDPDPGSAAFRDAARSLAIALEAAGWEPVGAGAAWYAMRFVWRGDGPPPADIPRREHGHSTT